MYIFTCSPAPSSTTSCFDYSLYILQFVALLLIWLGFTFTTSWLSRLPLCNFFSFSCLFNFSILIFPQIAFAKMKRFHVPRRCVWTLSLLYLLLLSILRLKRTTAVAWGIHCCPAALLLFLKKYQWHRYTSHSCLLHSFCFTLTKLQSAKSQ